VLAEPFNDVDRELNEGPSRYLYGYPDESRPETSPYYWWFQYLKRHAGYKECCERGGEGEHAALYLDWGDVRTDDFHDWFCDYGLGLFEEPYVLDELREVQSADQLEGLNWRDTMVVVVPVTIGNKNLSKKEIKRQFAILVDARFPDKPRGRPLYESAAKYKVRGYPRLDKLEERLRIYDMRMANPTWSLSKIGEQLALNGIFPSWMKYVTSLAEQGKLGESKRRSMGILVSQRLSKAKTQVKNSIKNIFEIV
jgi:hypothetical protein